jgi:hypothetical protein
VRRVLWIGLLVRLACVPAQLQWFHPDERQSLELAHFFAHGRLHPFLESRLHLRNLTAPWLFSWLVRACDALGAANPRAWLLAIQTAMACWSWVGFVALLHAFEGRGGEKWERRPEGRALAWVFALFWGFSFLWSRPLLEALSFPAAALLLLFSRRGDAFRAGLAAGAAAVLRYPSALFAPGAALAALWRRRALSPRALALAVAGLAAATVAGGLCDLASYGDFLGSAPAYFGFNRPHGPVEAMFGDDSLVVYWHWFEYLFTPWLAPLFLAASAAALCLRLELLAFCLPYLAGHLISPHREPRFMLPLTPFFCLAIAEAWSSPRAAGVTAWLSRSRAVRALAWAHVALALAWFPLYAWAQWQSGQSVLVRGYELVAGADLLLAPEAAHGPMIDALVPPGSRWAEDCRWHRPGPPAGRLLVLAREEPRGCEAVRGRGLPAWLERLARVRSARLWSCSREAESGICPGGITDAPSGEPYLGERL